MRPVGFRGIGSIIGAQAEDPGGDFLPELDSLRFRLAFRNHGERGFQGGIEARLLVGMEGNQYVVRRGRRRGLLGDVLVGRKLEPIGGIFSIDRVDGLEHCHV